MRPLERLLLIANALTYLGLVAGRPRLVGWRRGIALVTPSVAGAQVALEGIRRSMVPAYALSALLPLAWLWLGDGPAPSKGRSRAYRLAGLLAVGAGGTGLLLSTVASALRLPHPRGPHGIGTRTYHWVDTSRPEAFTADVTDRRELMVQVWYPAPKDHSAPRAPYIENAGVLGPLARLMRLPELALRPLEFVTTNAIPSAPVAHAEASYPVLLFSHGRGGFRQHNTMMVEELVSHGYVVAAIDHPYAASGVIFPDGRLVSLHPRMLDRGFVHGIVPYLAQDVSFTLDQLAALNRADPAGILTGRLDLGRVGVFGASLGGPVGAQACLQDRRLRACLVLDAFMPADVVREGMQQPTMWISRDVETMRREGWSQEDIEETSSTMRAVFEALPVDGYIVLVPGMFHVDISDVPLLWPLTSRLGISGRVDGRRVLDLMRDLALAFFDRHLRGLPAALLDDPTDRYPEVLFEARHPSALPAGLQECGDHDPSSSL